VLARPGGVAVGGGVVAVAVGGFASCDRPLPHYPSLSPSSFWVFVVRLGLKFG